LFPVNVHAIDASQNPKKPVSFLPSLFCRILKPFTDVTILMEKKEKENRNQKTVFVLKFCIVKKEHSKIYVSMDKHKIS